MVAEVTRTLRLAARSLARAPAFTVPAFAMLALGISAATAVFTVVDSIAFRPLDVPDAERVVMVCEDHPRLAGLCIVSPGNAEDLRTSGALEELGVGRGWSFALSVDEGTAGVRGGLATAAFFRALGARPTLGRPFADDEVGDRNRVALLSHGAWTSRFGADPGVVGSALRMDGAAYEVVGVLPEGFEAPLDLGGIEIWTPPHFDPLDPEVRGWRGFRGIGRLAPGTSLAAATAELTGAYAAIGRVHEEVDGEWRLRVSPMLDVVVGDARPALVTFLSASVLLLLIVCANVANLVLARGLARRRELAVRAALGASRRGLVVDIVAEGLILTVVAAVAALALSGVATRGLVALAPPEIPRLDEVSVDPRVFGFVGAVVVGVTALFAALPALRVTAWSVGDTLRAGARGGEGPGTERLRRALVVVEVALSVVLLASAGLLARSFARYLRWEPGFERASLMTVSAFADVSRYASRQELFSMWREATERIAAVPGVVAASTASAGPLFGGGDGATPYLVDGAGESDAPPSAQWFDVGPGFFRTLGVPVVAGREFDEHDDLDAPRVAVVNEAFVRAAWADGAAVGRTVRLPELERGLEVVGVVADVPPMTPGLPAPAQIYWPDRQLGRPATFLVVRASGDPSVVAAAVTRAALVADPELSLGTPRTLGAQERRALVRPRFQAVILAAFAIVALVLSAAGVYAVVAYAVARRAREVGIRVALGAGRGDVLGLVYRGAFGMAAVGVALGLAGSMITGRVIAPLARGVAPLDPASLMGAVVMLALAVVAAVSFPALRATRIDPVEAMRAD